MDTGTQADNNDGTATTCFLDSYIGYDSISTIVHDDWSFEVLKKKQQCFTERGHNWFYYDIFMPIPEKDIKISMSPCGDRSPPNKGILYLR